MSTKYKYPSELLYEATALADGDWIVVQKEGESRLSKITGANFGGINGLSKADGNIIVGDGTNWVAESGDTARASLGAQASSANLSAIAGLSYGNDNFIVGNGSTWVAESGATARTSMGAAPASGDLSVDWSCDDLRSTSGYFYQQASGGTNRGNINLYDTAASNAMVFRNAAGFIFFGLSGTTRGPVYFGKAETHSIEPLADSAYSIGTSLYRYANGYFDNLYTGPLQSGNILPIANNTYDLGSSAPNAWRTIYYYTATGYSDKREKTDIADSDLGLEFIDALHPVKFRWKVAEYLPSEEKDADGRPVLTPRPGVRFHYGLVADEVKEAMGDKDFGGYVKDAESGHQGLRWDEIDGVLIKAVQELHGQVKEERQARLALEQRLAALEMALGPIGGKQATS